MSCCKLFVLVRIANVYADVNMKSVRGRPTLLWSFNTNDVQIDDHEL